jgi:nicotinate dehydrogenase subunit B
VQIPRDDKGFSGGSEATNALVAPAVAAVIFDATRMHPRRMPLTPMYMTQFAEGLGQRPKPCCDLG